jgi:type II secretory pathway pseudopilin PulG
MKGCKGFTLTELIVAVIIFILTLLALFATYEVFYRTSKQQIATAQTSEKLRPAIEQLERFISDAGFGISKDDLDGDTSSTDYSNDEDEPEEGENIEENEENPDKSKDLAAISISTDNKIEFETNNSDSDYNKPVQIHLKSILGEYPFSGNYVVYDDYRFSNNSDDLLKSALGLPRDEPDANFKTIVMDINKNIINKNINEGLNNGLPDTGSLENGNIIFIGKSNAQDIDDYYYFKTIKLSSRTNDNEERGDNKYNICNPKTYNLQIVRGQGVPQPLIPCVAYFNADFGCYDGRKTKWQRDICKKIKDLRAVKIGLIVQSGFINKEYLYSEGDTLKFPTLGRTETSTDPVEFTIQVDNSNIRNDMRYYKWEIIERIIATPNVNF